MRLIIFILGLVLGLGTCLRFEHLNQKIYWYDEAFTSLRTAGYTEVEVVQHFAHSSVITVNELQQFQQPDLQRGLGDTLHSLAIEDTHHPPLYYSLAHIWMRTIGSSVTAMRSLSALLSLLIFPGLYWLCQELFGAKSALRGHTTGWMAMALVAVSPFHILYAQEARQYSLWAAMTVIMTAALLRAVRRNTVTSWGIYALILAASLYTFLFTGLVAIVHGIYMLVIAKGRFGSVFQRYLFASLLGTAIFLPWAWIISTNLEQAQVVTDWTTQQRPLLGLVFSWAKILGELFYKLGGMITNRVIQVGIILLIGSAFYALYRQTPKSVWALVVLLTAVPALALMLPDLLLGGQRSAFPRYLTPTLLGIQIAVAYLLTLKAIHPPPSAKAGHVFLWRSVMVAVIAGGLISSVTTVQASRASIKWLNDINLEVAPIVNQEENLLLISDTATADLLSLSYSLDPDVNLFIRPRCYTCRLDAPAGIDPAVLQIPEGYSSMLLFHPRSTREWRRSLQLVAGYQFEQVSTGKDQALWRVRRTEDETIS
jgi:uncharacterized membrane protein